MLTCVQVVGTQDIYQQIHELSRFQVGVLCKRQNTCIPMKCISLQNGKKTSPSLKIATNLNWMKNSSTTFSPNPSRAWYMHECTLNTAIYMSMRDSIPSIDREDIYNMNTAWQGRTQEDTWILLSSKRCPGRNLNQNVFLACSGRTNDTWELNSFGIMHTPSVTMNNNSQKLAMGHKSFISTINVQHRVACIILRIYFPGKSSTHSKSPPGATPRRRPFSFWLLRLPIEMRTQVDGTRAATPTESAFPWCHKSNGTTANRQSSDAHLLWKPVSLCGTCNVCKWSRVRLLGTCWLQQVWDGFHFKEAWKPWEPVLRLCMIRGRTVMVSLLAHNKNPPSDL